MTRRRSVRARNGYGLGGVESAKLRKQLALLLQQRGVHLGEPIAGGGIRRHALRELLRLVEELLARSEQRPRLGKLRHARLL